MMNSSSARSVPSPGLVVQQRQVRKRQILPDLISMNTASLAARNIPFPSPKHEAPYQLGERGIWVCFRHWRVALPSTAANHRGPNRRHIEHNQHKAPHGCTHCTQAGSPTGSAGPAALRAGQINSGESHSLRPGAEVCVIHTRMAGFGGSLAEILGRGEEIQVGLDSSPSWISTFGRSQGVGSHTDE